MGSTKISAPATPAAPTAAQTAQDYAAALPIYWENQLKYAPLEAQQQVDLANQYAGQLGTAMRSAQESMYPEETALNKQLTQQVSQGMQGGQMPDWAKQSYLDTMRGQLGDNAMSGVGADYMSRGLLDQQKSWQDYYTNLGLTLTGRQPVYQAQPTNYSNMVGNYTPSVANQYASSNYGNYSSAYANMYNTNAQNSGSPWANIAGSIGGGLLGGFTGGMGTAAGSNLGSKWFK